MGEIPVEFLLLFQRAARKKVLHPWKSCGFGLTSGIRSAGPGQAVAEHDDPLLALFTDTDFLEHGANSRKSIFCGENEVGPAVSVLMNKFMARVRVIRKGAAKAGRKSYGIR